MIEAKSLQTDKLPNISFIDQVSDALLRGNHWIGGCGALKGLMCGEAEKLREHVQVLGLATGVLVLIKGVRSEVDATLLVCKVLDDCSVAAVCEMFRLR